MDPIMDPIMELVGTLKVNLLQEDIDSGCKRSAYNCPMARAVRRAVCTDPDTPSNWEVSVSAFGIGIHNKQSDLCILMSCEPRVKQFIVDFDEPAGRTPVSALCNPFDFELEITEGCIEENIRDGK